MISGLVFFINTVWSYSTSTQEINQAPKCRSRNSFFTSFPKRNTPARKRTSDKGGKWIWLVTRRCDRPLEIDPEQGNLFGKFVPRVPWGGERERCSWERICMSGSLHQSEAKSQATLMMTSNLVVKSSGTVIDDISFFQDGPGRSSLCFKLTCYLFTSTQQLIFFLMWIALCDK